jgi:hypothetical protein
MERTGRVAGARGTAGAVAGMILAASLAFRPAAAAQTPHEATRPLPGDAGRTAPILVEPTAPADAAARQLAVAMAPPRVRLYSPPGAESETMRAAAAVDLTRALHLAGRAVYHPRPGMTMLDLEARVRSGPGASLSIRSISLHHLSGRRLPLQYRGRERRFAIGIGIPFD